MKFLKSFSTMLSLALLIAACSTSKKAAEADMKGPAGTWDTVVSGTPMGDVTAELVLMKEEDGYQGYVVSSGERMDLKNLKVEENKITGSFFSNSYGTDIYIDVDYKEELDKLEGWVMDSFKFTGTRKEAK